MKFILGLMLGIMLLGSIANATIWVRGYTRSNGTYVESYERSTPSENYTVRGEWKGW